MRYSANLNIIIKALEKASKHISRDFVEIENLQSNPATANKFTISCFNRVKDILISDFAKFRPDFTINFADGQIIGDPKNSEYHLTIHAIDGIENLCRASADFTVAIALSHRNNQKLEAISLAISKVIGGELFYSEKCVSRTFLLWKL
jgi:fructose-1,6-bisphosphatase/inositol monophosphatase family enzyme